MTLLCGAFLAAPTFAISESEVEAEVAASGKEAVVGNVLIWFLCAVAFLKVSQKIDSFMASLGVNVGHTGGSLMAEALIATRGIAMVAGMAGRTIGGMGRHSAGGASAQGVDGYFKGGLAGMASRRAANNAAKTATSNTTVPPTHTSAAGATSGSTQSSAHEAVHGPHGPIPAQASTMAQAPRLTDQSNMAPTFHQPAPPGSGTPPQPTQFAAPNESAPVGNAIPAPDEPEEQHPIILTDGKPPISMPGDITDGGADFSPIGGDTVIDNSEQSAAMTQNQAFMPGGSSGIIQTATQSKMQSSEKSSIQTSNRTAERSSTFTRASRSTHTSSVLSPSVGNSFKSYGIGGAMFMKSLASGGDFANDVIGRVARGDIQTTGTISGEMATQALNSYMGITALGEAPQRHPTYSNVEIGGGRISGVETAPGNTEGVEFCMYHTEQYAAPQGEHTQVYTADGASWYKQYAQDTVDRRPYNAPDGSIAYNETIVKRMPNPPQRKSRM